MILGFTGPRVGMSERQSRWLRQIFKEMKPDEFHHGACIGADEAAHWAAIDAGIPLIVIHPPVITRFMMSIGPYRAYPSKVKILPPNGYHARDKDIVHACDRLISTPAGEPTERSGTWWTINYALSQRRPVTLCYPSGEIQEL